MVSRPIAVPPRATASQQWLAKARRRTPQDRRALEMLAYRWRCNAETMRRAIACGLVNG